MEFEAKKTLIGRLRHSKVIWNLSEMGGGWKALALPTPAHGVNVIARQCLGLIIEPMHSGEGGSGQSKMFGRPNIQEGHLCSDSRVCGCHMSS